MQIKYQAKIQFTQYCAAKTGRPDGCPVIYELFQDMLCNCFSTFVSDVHNCCKGSIFQL